MSSDIVVNLLSGTYDQSQTWTLSPGAGDGGANGHNVIYQAAGYGTANPAAPVISGGTPVTGWTLADSGKNIWKADVGNLVTRQLYVNGKRAYRAQLPHGLSGTITQSSTGYTTTDTSPQSWANPSNVEFLYNSGDGAGNWNWAEPRCPVASVSGTASSTTITMAQPCFGLVLSARGGKVGLPTAIENNYQFLTTGEFYVDQSSAGAHELYYIPRAGENLATAQVEAPSLETVVKGDGTLTNPISNLAFKGITFADSTWLRPGTTLGFPETSYNKMNNPSGPETQIQAGVWFYAAHHVEFDGDTFTRMGGAGLTLDDGSQHNTVVGSVFDDISGNGVQIGNVDLNTADNPGLVTDNTVSDNYIHDIGLEYPGAYGIWNADTQNTTASHNEIDNLPRGGIATNYEYSNGVNVASGNRFLYNDVSNYMNVMKDGGGFDTNGPQNGVDGIHPDSELIGNVFHGDHNLFGQIYMDFWTAGYTVRNNVAYDSASLDYNTIDDTGTDWPCCNAESYNFYDQDNSFKYLFKADMITGNAVLPISSMPESIIENAGLQPAYRYLLPGSTPPSDTRPPTAPGSASASRVQAGPSITVSWSAATDNVGVTGYEVDNGDTVVAATNGTTTSVKAPGLAPGHSYDLTVHARDAAGNLSPASNTVHVEIPGRTDLVGHWTFDDGTGTTAADSSGSDNNGTISNGSWVVGNIGGGLQFNGSTSSVSMGNAQILNQDRHNFTISAAFKTQGAGWERLVTKGHYGNTTGYFMEYNSGGISFGVGANEQAAHATVVNTPQTFGDNTWHTATAVVDRTAQTITIYIDGKAQPLTVSSGFCGTAGATTASIAGCPWLSASSNDPFTVGSYNGTAEFFSGQIDDVRVYNRALSAADVAYLAGNRHSVQRR
jgi:hypothetical protein